VALDIELYEGDRRALLPLFALADDSPGHIDSYLPLGEILVGREAGLIVGIAQVIETGSAGEYELNSLAVLESRQHGGIGRQLVAAVIERCRERAGRRLIVATATASIGNLRFYQRLGFRMYQVVQDAFGPATGYPDELFIDGIPLRDQVRFELALER
jgi:GNAT superfamily N-acetyltransferase